MISNAPSTNGPLLFAEHDVFSDTSSFDDILCEFGWRKCGDDAWCRATPSGNVQLCSVSCTTAWRRCELTGGAIRQPSAGQHLLRNSRLAGPLKYVVHSPGDVRCRCDLPQLLDDADSGVRFAECVTGEPFTVQWVRAVTQCVSGHLPEQSPVVDLDRLVEYLTHRGRAASRDGDSVLVHCHLPGAFGQIRCGRDARVGFRLRAELLTFSGRRSHLHAAATRLATEANRRLPLVRFTVGETRPSVLSCEVCLGDALIPSVWLMVALETVETAMSLTLRELQALWDPTLARLMVAVYTA